MGSALTFEVSRLLGGDGRRIDVRERIELPPFEGFTFPSLAQVDLVVRGVGRGILVDGTVDVRFERPCDRCLETVSAPLHVEVDERFDLPGAARTDPFDENNVFVGEKLDVGDLVRQIVDTALPFGLVCGDGCRGLCAHCGANRNVNLCTCPESV